MFALMQVQKVVYLDTLDLAAMSSGWGTPMANRSVEGHVLAIGGREYQRGVGTHAESRVTVDLGGKCKRFTANVGVDDEICSKGSVEFKVLEGGRVLFDSGVIRPGTTRPLDLDVKGLNRITLVVTDALDGIDSDHGDWCDARFVSSSPSFIPFAVRPQSAETTSYLYPVDTEGEGIDAPEIVLPLHFISLSDDDGREDRHFSRNLIPGILLVLNKAYRKAHVRFECNPDTDYEQIRSTSLNRDFDPDPGVYTDPNQKPPMRGAAVRGKLRDDLAWKYRTRIPIICRRASDWQFDKSLGRWVDRPAPFNYGGGYIFSPALSDDPGMFCHEMGHSLGLPHTFEARPETIEEAAKLIRAAVDKGLPRDRGLEALDGDLPWIKDTPPDISETAVFQTTHQRWKKAPTVTIPVTFADGNTVNYELHPDPFNFMSYFFEGRLQHPIEHRIVAHFSKGQLAIIRRKAEQRFDDLGRIPDPTKGPNGIRWEFANANRSSATGWSMIQDLPESFGPPDLGQKTAGKMVFWKLLPNQNVKFQFPNLEKGRYRVWWSGSYSSDYGKFGMSVNGNPLRTFDGFLPTWAPTGWRNMGDCDLSGPITVAFTMLPPNPQTTASFLGTASVVFEKLR
jgi:hypothetical protein